MTQPRRHSALEAAANVLVGMGINLGANAVILPAFGFRITTGQNLGMMGIYTLISVGRSYALRRVFNRFHRPTPHGGAMSLDRATLEAVLGLSRHAGISIDGKYTVPCIAAHEVQALLSATEAPREAESRKVMKAMDGWLHYESACCKLYDHVPAPTTEADAWLARQRKDAKND